VQYGDVTVAAVVLTDHHTQSAVAMNLARVLFKKQQQRGSSLDDGAPASVDSQASGCSSPTPGGVETLLDGETSPSTRSSRRKARSTASSVDGALPPKSSDALSSSPHANVIFKAIKMSSHKRFAQVLPNLLLGTSITSAFSCYLIHSYVDNYDKRCRRQIPT